MIMVEEKVIAIAIYADGNTSNPSNWAIRKLITEVNNIWPIPVISATRPMLGRSRMFISRPRRKRSRATPICPNPEKTSISAITPVTPSKRPAKR